MPISKFYKAGRGGVRGRKKRREREKQKERGQVRAPPPFRRVVFFFFFLLFFKLFIFLDIRNQNLNFNLSKDMKQNIAKY